jgi:uncharacterized protein YjbI with pentapeptide repeats
MQLYQDQQFENIDYSSDGLPKGEYENCIFKNCNFSNTNLSNYTFIDSSFENSNLSLVKINNTIIRDIKFKGCKMIGMQFCDANAFGLAFSFEDCILTNASFYKTKIKKTSFLNSKLNEVDFTETDLTRSTYFWTSNEVSPGSGNAFTWSLLDGPTTLAQSGQGKIGGFSVRCIHD